MNKSLNLDILVSPEIGSGIFLFGLTLILYGYRQSKKDFDLDRDCIKKNYQIFINQKKD